MDVEFLVEMFQLKYGPGNPSLRRSNLWDALTALETAGLLTTQEKTALETGYDFLLRLQSRLRLVFNRTMDELPTRADEVDKLVRRLGFESGALFLSLREQHTRQIRALFDHLLNQESRGGNDQFPNDQFPNDQFPNDQFPNDQFPNDQFPNDQFPNDQ